MPVAIVKRYELSAAETRDWFRALNALPGEQFSEAFGAEGFFVFRGKLLGRQESVAVHAGEAVAMERCVPVGDATFVDHSVALETALGVLLLVARNAGHFLVTWYETLHSDWLKTDLTAEALFVPLFASVFVFLHTRSEESSASVTFGGEVVVMAIGAEQLVFLVGERSVDERHVTIAAQEALLVPVFLLVRQIL